MKKTLLTERFQQLAGIKPLSEQPDDLERLGSTMAKGFDDRLAQQMGMSDDEFEDQVASRDIGDDSFGSAGTDKRTQQVITDTLQLIRRSGDATLAMDVMEGIGKEFKIKGCVGEFEFSGGAPDPNDGLPKMDPDNWGFKQAGEESGMDMRGIE